MKHKHFKNNRGFSLIELIIVIAIMAILVGILAPQFIKYVSKARMAKARTEASNVVHSIDIIYADGLSAETIPTSAEIQEAANVTGTISDITISNGSAVHLTYTNSDYKVIYCRDYATCAAHSELYTIDGESASGSEAAPETPASDSSTYYFIGNNNESVALPVTVNLDTLFDGEKNQYGTNVPYQSIVYSNGKYYWLKIGNNIRPDSNKIYWLSQYAIELAPSISEPSTASNSGDIRYVNGHYEVFAPYDNNSYAYQNSGYWHTLSTK